MMKYQWKNRWNKIGWYILTVVIVLHAQPRNILTSRYSVDQIQTIISAKPWHPYPTASERVPWTNLPESFKTGITKKAELLLKKEYPALTATLYLEFVRIGDRQNYERPCFERRQMLETLVIAECIEGRGRFLDKIVDGLWLISEESSWIVPAHIGEQKAGRGLPDVQEPLVDLFSAETGNLFAWTYYLLNDQLQKISPLICDRIYHELQERIIIPTSTRDDMWWMHLEKGKTVHYISNWTPWICLNWLAVELLTDADLVRQTKMVFKIITILDRFLNSYPDDGGCNEGPYYWRRAGGSLFDCLELLYNVSGGKINVYDHPLVKNIGRFIAYSYINRKYFLNFGDAPAQIDIPAHLVLRYGERINDADLIGLGWEAESRQNMSAGELEGSLTRQLDLLFHPVAVDTHSIHVHLHRDVWLPQTEMMVARQLENSNAGFYLAAIGGYNEHSHNHNDVGNFIVYLDGDPLFVDVGVGTYTAKTFSDDRYSIWTMQSAYHNLPTINGAMQKFGIQYRSQFVQYQQSDSQASMTLDISGAYPSIAGIKFWNRTVLLDRSHQEIRINEAYRADTAVQSFTLSLMTPCEVVSVGSDSLMVKIQQGKEEKSALLCFDHRQIVPTVEQIPLEDEKLKHAWGDRLFRILFRGQKKLTSDEISMTVTRLRK